MNKCRANHNSISSTIPYIFSLLCSNWRFIDGLRCASYPDVCEACDQENSSFHVLFLCPHFDYIRAKFRRVTRRAFALDVFSSDDRDVQSAICIVGREMYARIVAECESYVTSQQAEHPSSVSPRPRQRRRHRDRQNVMSVLNDSERPVVQSSRAV
jgi:hypothetical protein